MCEGNLVIKETCVYSVPSGRVLNPEPRNMIGVPKTTLLITKAGGTHIYSEQGMWFDSKYATMRAFLEVQEIDMCV